MLSQSKHRFILIKTDDLKSILQDSFSKEVAYKGFLELMISGMKLWDGVMHIENLEKIKEEFAKDFMNNDAPIFYIDKKNIIYYGNNRVGYLKYKSRIEEEIK